MIKNTAFLAALVLFLLVCWLGGELAFLAPYKRLLFREYGWVIASAALLVFLHLFVAFYAFARWMFLRDAGRKLVHLDRQLTASDAAIDDLRQHLHP